jgi:dipeptidyl aminopeptidase/acylaminoacyl peptidase
LPGAEGGEDGSALYRMDIDTGQWRAIAYERSGHDIDILPKVSPDGRWIAFQRNISLGDLWRMPVAGGKPERLTTLRTNFHGLAWTPDSRALVFARLVGGRIGLRRLDLASGAIADYTVDDAMLIAPSIGSGGDLVAFAVEVERTQLREVALADGTDAYARSRPVFPSSRSDLLPALAPDGRQLLFVSDRDGQERLWWGELGRPDSLRPIHGLVPMPRLPSVWRADASRALTVGELPDGSKRVYEIEPERGRVRMLETPDAVPVHAAYHTDPDRILIVAEREQGRLGMTLYDRSVRPWRPLAHVEDVVLALTDPHERRILLVRTFEPGLWQVDLDLRGMRQIDTVAYQARIRSLMLGADGAWIADADKTCEWRLRRVKGTHAPQSHCMGSGPFWPLGFGFDDARRRWVASATTESGSDIGVLPLSALLPAGEGQGASATAR